MCLSICCNRLLRDFFYTLSVYNIGRDPSLTVTFLSHMYIATYCVLQYIRHILHGKAFSTYEAHTHHAMRMAITSIVSSTAASFYSPRSRGSTVYYDWHPLPSKLNSTNSTVPCRAKYMCRTRGERHEDDSARQQQQPIHASVFDAFRRRRARANRSHDGGGWLNRSRETFRPRVTGCLCAFCKKYIEHPLLRELYATSKRKAATLLTHPSADPLPLWVVV